LVSKNYEDLECKVCHGPVDITGIKVPVTTGLVGQAYRERKGSLIEDAYASASHNQTVDAKTGFVTKSILTMPVLFGGKCFGCLQAINRVTPAGEICEFTNEHMTVFQRLADLLGVALQNVDLASELVKDALLKKDLLSAEELQSNLFPSQGAFKQIVGLVIPARNLSGDFLDFFELNGEIIFCQGDVAGKGVPASLTVARCLALFRWFAKTGNSPSEIAEKLNTEIYETFMQSDKSAGFVTFFTGAYNLQNGKVEFVNCGHGDVLHVNQSLEVQAHSASLPPLGVVSSPELDYVSQKLDLSNSRLFVFTDGILEARNSGRELGLQGVVGLSKAVSKLSMPAALNKIMNLFKDGRLVTGDDATMMIIGK
jgi:sigma-B regulation protein RsbU (phosphoserine phosphatase)